VILIEIEVGDPSIVSQGTSVSKLIFRPAENRMGGPDTPTPRETNTCVQGVFTRPARYFLP